MQTEEERERERDFVDMPVTYHFIRFWLENVHKLRNCGQYSLQFMADASFTSAA
jgi:hypothetical protein